MNRLNKLHHLARLSLLVISLINLIGLHSNQSEAFGNFPHQTSARKAIQCGQSGLAVPFSSKVSSLEARIHTGKKDPNKWTPSETKTKQQDNQVEQIPAGEAPFHASLLLDGMTNCSGVIIDKKHILTVGKCLVDNSSCRQGRTVKYDEDRLRVLVGETDFKKHDGEQFVGVEKITVHPGYCASLAKSDNIGIVKLKNKLTWRLTRSGLGSTNQVCLPRESGQDYFEDQIVFSSGFFLNATQTMMMENTVASPGTRFSGLLYLEDNMKIVGRERCKTAWKAPNSKHNVVVTDEIICAKGNVDLRNSCLNDLGGPLYLRSYVNNFRAEVIGLRTESGLDNCSSSWPHPFIRVSHYLKWIKLNTL